MTADQARKLLAVIAERDASEAFSRAAGWVVLVTHVDDSGGVLGAYGPFSEPAGALEHAAQQESELNQDEEEGFKCRVHPIMPVS